MTHCPIAHWKKQCPNAPAFEDLTYLELERLIQKLCYSLTNVPYSILIFAPEKTALDVALFFAAWRLGKAVYPLNPRLPEKAIQMRIEKTSGKWIDLKSLSLSGSLEISHIDSALPATLLETSSATKIVCHSLQSHLISAMNGAAFLNLSSTSIYCLNLPLFHVSGIASFLRTFLTGGQLILPETKILPTHISMVPTQLYRLLQREKLPKHLRCLLVGGAPLSPSLYNQALSLGLPVFLSYGMTETASMAIGKPPYQPSKILPHIECKIGDDKEILLRGPSLFSGYFEEKAREGSEWFATKDLGEIHNGEFKIIGRKDRQFISGGENIQPEEIELALLECDQVLEARVYPLSDPEFGMRPIAQVYSSISLTPELLIQQLKKKLPPYKLPVKIAISTIPFASKLSKMS